MIDAAWGGTLAGAAGGGPHIHDLRKDDVSVSRAGTIGVLIPGERTYSEPIALGQAHGKLLRRIGGKIGALNIKTAQIAINLRGLIKPHQVQPVNEHPY